MDAISFGDVIKTTKKCIKCDERVICNLNIAYNAVNTTFALWNKFQMFLYEELVFERASKTIIPEFQIHKVITSNDYVICMDDNGNVHTTPLKFKNTDQKKNKHGFHTRVKSVVAFSLINQDYALCLKYESLDYFLDLHKIHSEFSLVKSAVLTATDQFLLQQNTEKYLLKSYQINGRHINIVKKIFNVDSIDTNNDSIVFISFDKLSVFTCVFNHRTSESAINLVKLYTCPAEIASIDLIESDNMNVIVALTMGTIICLNLNELTSPQIIHLNIAIHKLLASNDTVFYTDGITMWKAEHILATDIKFSQLFVNDVKDFIKFGDQILCTTFKNMMYIFSIDDESCYRKPQSIGDYCPAEMVLSNSDYLDQIRAELNKSKELLTMQTMQQEYITTLCLTNRQDIVEEIMGQMVVVYESYREAISEHPELVLTNQLSEYFENDSFYVLLKIITFRDHRLSSFLTGSIGDLRIHVTIKSKGKIIKTTSVKITDVIKSESFLIPLQLKFIIPTDMTVESKVVTLIPGALDPKQKIWVILYRKTFPLTADNFIRLKIKDKAIKCLKDSNKSLEELILQTTMKHYGSLFDFTDITDKRQAAKLFPAYVRLPPQYRELFYNAVRQPSKSNKVNYLLQLFTSENFIKQQHHLYVTVANEQVKLEIISDGFSSPTLKVSSENPKVALDVRNFLSILILKMHPHCDPGILFISHTFYRTVEVSLVNSSI